MTDRPARHRCARDSCGRHARDPHKWCSTLCREVDVAQDQAKRVCEFTGDSQHWLHAIELGESLDAYRKSDQRAYQAAREVGMTSEQWKTIKFGATSHDQAGQLPTRR